MTPEQVGALRTDLTAKQVEVAAFARQMEALGYTELGDALSKASGWLVEALSRLRKEADGQ